MRQELKEEIEKSESVQSSLRNANERNAEFEATEKRNQDQIRELQNGQNEQIAKIHQLESEGKVRENDLAEARKLLEKARGEIYRHEETIAQLKGP